MDTSTEKTQSLDDLEHRTLDATENGEPAEFDAVKGGRAGSGAQGDYPVIKMEDVLITGV